MCDGIPQTVQSQSTVFLALTVALMMVAAVPAAAGGRPLTAALNGPNEVTPGDPDGTGPCIWH